MPGARTIGRTLLSAGALLAWSGAAHADAASESRRFNLVYEAHPAPAPPPGSSPGAAPDTCPDREAFVSAVRARTPRSQLAVGADEASEAISFRVAIEGGATSTSGQLDVREPGGATQQRSVSSRTCGEVAKALALVAALILDPDARTSDAETPPFPESPPVPPAPPPLAPARPPPRSAPSPAPPAATLAPHAWRIAAGGELGAIGGIGPDLAPMGGAFIDVGLRTRRLLAPAFRLTVDLAATGNDLRSGSQSYWWLAWTLRGCPIHVVLPARFRLGPCVGLQIGVHHGVTSDVANPTSHSDLWLAPLAEGTLEWAATPKITVELRGGGLVPLRRTRFFLAPNTTLYEVPPVAGTFGLSFRVTFL